MQFSGVLGEYPGVFDGKRPNGKLLLILFVVVKTR